MIRRSRFSPEVHERAARMVFERGSEYDSEWGAMRSIAEKRMGKPNRFGEATTAA